MSGTSGTSKPESKESGLDGLLGDSYQALLAMNVFVEAVIRQIDGLELEREVKGVGALDDVVYHKGDKQYILLQAKHKTSKHINAIQGSNLIADFSDDYSLGKYIWSHSEAEDTYKKKKGSVQRAFIFTNISLNVSETGEVTVMKKKPNYMKTSIKVKKIDLEKTDMFYIQTENGPKVEFYQFEYETTKGALLEFISKYKSNDKSKDKDKFKKLENDQRRIKDALSNIVYAVNQCNEDELAEMNKEKLRLNFKLISPDTVFNKLKIELLDWMTRKPSTFPLTITYKFAKEFLTQNLKKIYFHVIPPTESITGREDVIDEIKKQLQSSDSKTIAINGPGGIGKTEVCRQYIQLYQDDYYGRIVWIDAEKKEFLESSFEQLAKYLEIGDKVDAVGSRKRKHSSDVSMNTISDLRDKTQLRIDFVLNYFENVRVLFVFDNVIRYVGEEQGDYIRYFRNTLRNKTQIDCDIIINSKDKDIGGKIESIDLNVLIKDNAVKLIKKLFKDENINVYDVECLAYKLENFPLAIQQVVAFIMVQLDKAAMFNKTYGIQDYIKELKIKESLEFKFKDDLGDSYEKTTFLNFSISIDCIKKTDHGENAWTILQFMAYLSPDNIDPNIFLPDIGETVYESIKILERYCLINRTSRSKFSIHRLFQKVVQIILKDSKQEDVVLDKILKLIFNKNLTDKMHIISVWSFALKHKRLLEIHGLTPDDVGRTAIHYCALLGDADALSQLFTIDKVVDRRTSEHFLTPLHIASINGHSDVAKLLIDNGADPVATEKNGYNAMHIAAQSGHFEIVKLLYFAIVNLKERGNVDASIDAITTVEKFTPLHLAASNGYLKIVEFLVEQGGADTKIYCKHEFTPLQSASVSGHLDIVKFLAERENDLIGSFNAVLVAAQNNHLNVVEYLFKHYFENIDEADEDRWTSLHIAITNGCFEVAEWLIRNGASVNASNKNGFTPLHLAAQNGYVDIATLLIIKEADLNAREEKNFSPLMIAAFEGHTSMVNLLCVKGAKIDVTDVDDCHEEATDEEDDVDENDGCNAEVTKEEEDDENEDDNNMKGCSAVYWAAQNCHLETVMTLRQNGANIDYGNVHPLLIAAYTGRVDIFKFLFENTTHTNIRADSNYSLLHIATQNNHIEIIKFLISKNVDVNEKADENVTSMHIAAENGLTEIVKCLIENEADKDASDENNNTPIFLAAKHDHYDVVALLLNEANVNVLTNDEHESPLHMAAQNGNEKMITILLEKRALVNQKTKKGYTPFHLAALHNDHCNIVRILHRKGANLNEKSEAGHSPFYLAAHNGNLDIVKFFISKKVDINEPDCENVRPLHGAALNGHSQVIELIIKNENVDVNTKTFENVTPLHLACKGGHLEVVKLLLENEADVDARTCQNKTPLEFVDRNKHQDIADFLINFIRQKTQVQAR